VIAVHRISQPEHELYVNPDLIQVVEANPDTVLALVNGVRLVVIESPAEVARLVREWRVAILTDSHQPVAVADARASAGRLAPVVALPQQTSQAD
jgi:flagellar protein FlbD